MTVRVRLTLLYSGLFTVCGAILVALTYALLAANLPAAEPSKSVPKDFAAACAEATADPEANPDVVNKCRAIYQEGLTNGAAVQRQATLDQLLWFSSGGLLVVTVLAAAAGWIIAGRVLRPVHRITEAARSASEDHLDARLALTGPRDELRELADTFDAMLDRLQAAFQGQRRFIANAGHELRTPLTVVRTAVDVVLAKPEPTREELIGMGRDVRVAVCHAQALIEALLTLARTETGRFDREAVDLATITEDALDAAGSAVAAVGLHLTLGEARTNGNPILLERLVVNLLDNALRYNVPRGAVWIRTATLDDCAMLSVDNTGPDVPPEAVSKLFEPFYRVAERTGDGGSGLGLAIVASIAAAHGGQATAHARPSGGLSVKVTLPRAFPPSVSPPTATRLRASPSRATLPTASPPTASPPTATLPRASSPTSVRSPAPPPTATRSPLLLPAPLMPTPVPAKAQQVEVPAEALRTVMSTTAMPVATFSATTARTPTGSASPQDQTGSRRGRGGHSADL